MKKDQTEVLVVGAGPVGLMTAVLLAEAGVEVQIIDREARTTARSYACVLHPHSLKSLERQRLGNEYERVADAESFAVFEFASDAQAEDEVRVVLDEATTNVLWPLPGNKYRWTFQLSHSEVPSEFPNKKRRALHFVQ